MSEPQRIDPKRLRPGPIRHKTLPPELFEQVKAIFDAIGPYIGMTLEQFEIGFMRDMHAESEVAVWCSITAAWLAYHDKFLGDHVTGNEVRCSEDIPQQYHLFRVFDFGREPRLYILHGSLRVLCQLDPVLYRAVI